MFTQFKKSLKIPKNIELSTDWLIDLWRFTSLSTIFQLYRGDQFLLVKVSNKRTNNDLQNIHINLKIEQHEPHYKPGVNSGTPEG
jgi:hypothetical protein